MAPFIECSITKCSLLTRTISEISGGLNNMLIATTHPNHTSQVPDYKSSPQQKPESWEQSWAQCLLSFVHFSNHFILDPEPILGILGARQEHTLNGMTVHCRPPWIHIFPPTDNFVWPVQLLAGFWEVGRKLEALKETHTVTGSIWNSMQTVSKP